MTRDTSKLPKWAQTEIETLKMRIAEKDAALAEGPEDSTVFLDSYDDVPRPLGKDPTVEFRVADSPHGRPEYIMVQRERGTNALRIYASEAIAVRPAASNVIHVHNVRL